MTRYFVHRHLVTFEDTNLVGNVYFANHVRWQGHCREAFLIEHTPGVMASLATDLALVTLSCECRYLAELYAGDTVEIRMSLDGADGDRIAMRFDYYRLGDGPAQLVARGRQEVACMRRTERGTTSMPIPDELAAALDRFRGPGGHPP